MELHTANKAHATGSNHKPSSPELVRNPAKDENCNCAAGGPDDGEQGGVVAGAYGLSASAWTRHNKKT